MQVVLLDAGPLGLATNPKRSAQSVACAQWLQAVVTEGTRVVVPEIADYEVRRELLRGKKTKGLLRLDALAAVLEYLPITTPAMRLAAQLWAEARQQGLPTADDKAIDADMILVAQARTLVSDSAVDASKVIIATTNVGHLSRFARAELWQSIRTH
jgi:predicted nucleic acid-binding protein